LESEHFALSYKRADRGTFRVPEASVADATSIELSERELEEPLDGMDVNAEPKARRSRRPRVH
jgi:hypothetical protein